ncbi:helix-turn-helix transcriptional regulator [Kitasatospora sp. NPDC047058]|uniref:helix-turn-helix transcriptional regulator n=1 Tax=Kitasatospora sp. NPDC047058 TaxID=3155620 RepID=UPI00340CFD30
MYAEINAPEAGGVLWTSTPAAPGLQRILPDGCLDLIWTGGELLVAGPDTTAVLVGAGPQRGTTVGLRFAPGTGPVVLGVPAHELRDRRVPLAALWPGADVRRLTERLTERAPERLTERLTERATERVADADAPGRLLRALAAARLDAPGPIRPDPIVPEVLAGLAAGEPVAACAARAGYSERQLHRRCQASFGYGLKTLARILRMNRSVGLARAGRPFAEIAATVGYADQAHLSREVRALAGVPLSALT